MSARIDRILDALETELLRVSPVLTFHRGQRELAKNERPPRIVWVKGPDKYGPPVKGGFNPRPLFTRAASVEAHIWGIDLGTTEDLLHAVLALAHKLAHGSMAVMGSHWPQPEWLHHGFVCVLGLSFDIPVTADLLPVAKVTDFVPDPDAVPGGGLTCGSE